MALFYGVLRDPISYGFILHHLQSVALVIVTLDGASVMTSMSQYSAFVS